MGKLDKYLQSDAVGLASEIVAELEARMPGTQASMQGIQQAIKGIQPAIVQILQQGLGEVIQRTDAMSRGLAQVQREVRSQAESGANNQQILGGVAQMLSQLRLPDNSAELTMLNAKVDAILTKPGAETWVFDITRNDDGLITSVVATEGGE